MYLLATAKAALLSNTIISPSSEGRVQEPYIDNTTNIDIFMLLGDNDNFLNKTNRQNDKVCIITIISSVLHVTVN